MHALLEEVVDQRGEDISRGLRVLVASSFMKTRLLVITHASVDNLMVAMFIQM